MTDTQKIVLHAENACKQYEMANGAVLTAVSGVSFDISKGECLAVIGESGCGKSTLAKLVTGIEPLTDGKILFQDADIAKLGNAQMKNIRRNMQMIFQNAEDAISPRMKIGSFLMEPWINFRLGDKHAAQQKISEMLTKVRLGEDILNRYPHQLSGGELQRVCIARAFAMEPELLVCDEITSALDVSVQDDVMKLFRRIQTETGTACLMICHDLALVHSYSDRVMVMYLGQVVEMMNSLDLGVKALHPYTQGLLKAMFCIGSNRRGNPMQTLEGEPPSPINLPKGCCFCGRCSKATDICRSELPKLKQIASGHFVACHLL